jgi:hypothetical protein
LERGVEAHEVVGGQFEEEIGGEDFGEGAKAQERIRAWRLAAANGGFAVAAEEDLVAAHDEEHEAG